MSVVVAIIVTCWLKHGETTSPWMEMRMKSSHERIFRQSELRSEKLFVSCAKNLLNTNEKVCEENDLLGFFLKAPPVDFQWDSTVRKQHEWNRRQWVVRMKSKLSSSQVAHKVDTKCGTKIVSRNIFSIGASEPESEIVSILHFLCMLTWKGFLSGRKGYKSPPTMTSKRCCMPTSTGKLPVDHRSGTFEGILVSSLPLISMQILARVRSNKKCFARILFCDLWNLWKLIDCGAISVLRQVTLGALARNVDLMN